jgi:hypothetical protein
VAEDAPREVVVEEIEEVVEVTGTGDGTLTETVVDEVIVEEGAS